MKVGKLCLSPPRRGFRLLNFQSCAYGSGWSPAVRAWNIQLGISGLPDILAQSVVRLIPGWCGPSTVGPAPARRRRIIGSSPVCCRTPKSAGPTGCGRPTSSTCPRPGDSSTWWRLWTGQPVRSGLAAVPHPRSGSGADSGGGLLRRSFAGSVEPGQARDIQHRPGQSVHKQGVHSSALGSRSADQHGWEGAVRRQLLREACSAQLPLPACCLTEECYRNFSTWDPLQPVPVLAIHWAPLTLHQSQSKPT